MGDTEDGIIEIGGVRLWPRKVAALKLNVVEMTLIRWERDHKGPPVIRVGHKPYYSAASVEKWLMKAFEKAEKAG